VRLALSVLFLLANLAGGLSLCLCALSACGDGRNCHASEDACGACDGPGVRDAGHDCHDLTFEPLPPAERQANGVAAPRNPPPASTAAPRACGAPYACPRAIHGSRYRPPGDCPRCGLTLMRTARILC